MRILYILSAMFPFGRAYAARAMNLCRALRAGGCDVDVLADYISDKAYLDADGVGRYEDVRIFLSTDHAAAERTLADKRTVARKAEGALKAYLAENRPDCVIMSSASDRFLRLAKTVKRHGIPIVLESCEWFDSYNWERGKLDPRYHRFQRFWKKSPAMVDGVIAISQLLEERYGQYVPTIRVPGLADPKSFFDCGGGRHDRIRLAFVGEIVCGKDNVSETIRAIAEADLAEKIEFHIFGPGKEEIEKQLEQPLPGFVTAHGFVKQDEMLSRLREMDFGLIIRPDRRSSHAGFPTKLVEYLSQGLPVIANLTGDIGLYLKDGVNGYVVSGNDRTAVAESLRRAVNDYDVFYETMRRNALHTAAAHFDYHLYTDSLCGLIRQCLGE